MFLETTAGVKLRRSRMREDLQLGYLVLGTADPGQLVGEFTNVFGFLATPAPNGATTFRIDGWARRFLVEPAPTDGLRAVGLVARDTAAYDAAVARLESQSVQVRKGTPGECEYRGVRQLVSFADPAGTPLELAVGASVTSLVPYASPLVPGGFRTGAAGLGHAVLIVQDRQACVDFYVQSLGFIVSDTSEQETQDGLAEATFLHCNRRHHTIAIAQRPVPSTSTTRLGHVMVEVNEYDAVGMAYDRAVDAKMPISRSLGRHPNDRMFSFYATTSAGFDVEIGAGAVEVGDTWEVNHYRQFSAWGHRRGPGSLYAYGSGTAVNDEEHRKSVSVDLVGEPVAAMAGISDGATVLIGGFGAAGQPLALIDALRRSAVRELTVVSNNAGNGDTGLAALLAAGQVRKIICSFPRQADSYVFDELYRTGKIELELVPQGNLAERIRAAGAGIGAFYCPTGVGTRLTQGKELRTIDGRDYALEYPLHGDVALIKAHRADTMGNLVYRKTARNFGPVMAMAAAMTIAQVEVVVAAGQLDPEAVVTPGIFVDRIVACPPAQALGREAAIR
jgi:3-oxoadipate CoA-transferase, alpha subunit